MHFRNLLSHTFFSRDFSKLFREAKKNSKMHNECGKGPRILAQILCLVKLPDCFYFFLEICNHIKSHFFLTCNKMFIAKSQIETREHKWCILSNSRTEMTTQPWYNIYLLRIQWAFMAIMGSHIGAVKASSLVCCECTGDVAWGPNTVLLFFWWKSQSLWCSAMV